MQRAAGEALLPEPRGQFGDARSWVVPNALQNVHQVVVGIDLMQAAGREQTLHYADVLGTELCPGEEPIPAAMGITRRARSRWFVSIWTSGNPQRPVMRRALERIRENNVVCTKILRIIRGMLSGFIIPGASHVYSRIIPRERCLVEAIG